MSLKDFELIGDHKVKCKTCGLVLPTGIAGISEHWANCTGKDFYSAIIKAALSDELSFDKIEELQDKHLKK